MKNNDRLLRTSSILLLLLTSCSALYAGFLLIVSPDGALLGLSVSVLRHSPFTDFLGPGIILLVANGVFNIIVALFTIFKSRRYASMIVFQGIVLTGWIVVQVGMLQEINGLHLLMASIGIALILMGTRINSGTRNK